MSAQSSHTSQFSRNRILLLIIAIVIVGIAVWIGKAVQAPRTDNASKTNKVSLTGKLVCLPHKNSDGPQTLECAYGFRTEGGTYYALREKDQSNPVLNAVPNDETVEVSGTLQEGTSATYKMEGTITVEKLTL